MARLSAIPSASVPVSMKHQDGDETVNPPWFRYLQDLGAQVGQAAQAITIGASPFTYTATSPGFVIIVGGTISSITFSRDGINFFALGVTPGPFPVMKNDKLVVTYTVAPTSMTLFPN